MASNVSTVDGMGFEEVNQASFTDIISGTNVYGTTGSFETTRTTNANIVGSVIDTQGRFRSLLLGSATANVWGGFIQAGSFNTSAGSQGVVIFGAPYSSSTSYYVTVTPCGSATSFDKSYISGTSRNASGCEFVGAASLRYNWIAAGI